MSKLQSFADLRSEQDPNSLLVGVLEDVFGADKEKVIAEAKALHNDGLLLIADSKKADEAARNLAACVEAREERVIGRKDKDGKYVVQPSEQFLAMVDVVYRADGGANGPHVQAFFKAIKDRAVAEIEAESPDVAQQYEALRRADESLLDFLRNHANKQGEAGRELIRKGNALLMDANLSGLCLKQKPKAAAA